MISNKKLRFHFFCIAALLPCTAGSYEAEDAVPLTLAATLGNTRIERIAITLDGRYLDITTTIKNDHLKAQKIGFYAYTPFFTQLGEGEEHADKTFSEIQILKPGYPPRRPASQRRGFFMGYDVTTALAKQGISPLPAANVSADALGRVVFPFDMRPSMWDGYVAYSWTESVAARATIASTIRYKAIPEFSLTDVASDNFNLIVQQHCGDAKRIQDHVRSKIGDTNQVLIERYRIPIKYMASAAVSIDIAQPRSNWLSAHPILSLLCGVSNSEIELNRSLTVTDANEEISVLIISKLATANDIHTEEK